RILRELLYKYLDDLIVLTKFDEEYYKAKKIKTTVIENAYTAMDVDNLNTISKGNVILSIGRHTSQKRFDKLLHIWKEIVKKNDGLKLRIVGDGPLLDENKKLAQKLNLSDSVVFAPPTKKINEEYQNASLFLMTSDYEAFPMVLLEALKNGLPCIAFDCDTGPRDIIVNGVDGFVIPINDSLKFVEKTIDVMNDENLRYQLSSNAKVNVERFNEEHISKKWLIKLKQLQ
ncbi:glycosyltransferase family 4 protein, partial [Escherichia coli]